MTGFPLIIAFIVAIVFMIVAISKFKIHPFLSIMGVSLILDWWQEFRWSTRPHRTELLPVVWQQ